MREAQLQIYTSTWAPLTPQGGAPTYMEDPVHAQPEGGVLNTTVLVMWFPSGRTDS